NVQSRGQRVVRGSRARRFRMDHRRSGTDRPVRGVHRRRPVASCRRERARRESPYGGPGAPGYLSLSLVAPTALDVFIRRAGIGQAFNYGLERVRFIAPVKARVRVRNRIVLLSVEKRGDEQLLLRTENRIEIEAEEKPAVLAVALVLVHRE